MSERVPYVNHGARHRPGGTDHSKWGLYKITLFPHQDLASDPVVEDASKYSSRWYFDLDDDLDGTTLIAARAVVSSPSTDEIKVDVAQWLPDPVSGTDESFFNDELVIDAGDFSSRTSASPYSLWGGPICSAGDWIGVYVHRADGNDARGLTVTLVFG